MTDCYSLGIAHRRREEAAASVAQRRDKLDDARARTSLVRWRGALAAIRASVAAYNDGLGRELLVVTVTDRPQPSATIESAAGTVPILTVTLDEGEIRVDRRATAPDHGETTRWVAMTRSDNDTAAYVLQEWLERL